MSQEMAGSNISSRFYKSLDVPPIKKALFSTDSRSAQNAYRRSTAPFNAVASALTKTVCHVLDAAYTFLHLRKKKKKKQFVNHTRIRVNCWIGLNVVI